MTELGYDIDEVFGFLTDKTDLDKRMTAHLDRIKREKPDAYWYGELRQRLLDAYNIYYLLNASGENLGTKLETVEDGLYLAMENAKTLETRDIGYDYNTLEAYIGRFEQVANDLGKFDRRALRKKQDVYEKSMVMFYRVMKRFGQLGVKKHPLSGRLCNVILQLESIAYSPMGRALVIKGEHLSHRRGVDSHMKSSKFFKHESGETYIEEFLERELSLKKK